LAEAVDAELLPAAQPQRLPALAALELQRQDAHADQVGAVDALEALGDHRADAEQERALGRPVPRGSRPVLLARQHDQRRALLLVAERGVEDGDLLPARLMGGPVTLFRRQLIA